MIRPFDGARGRTYRFRIVRQGQLYQGKGFASYQAAQDAEDLQLARLAGSGLPASDLFWATAVQQYQAAKAKKVDLLAHDVPRLDWWGRFFAGHQVATLGGITPELLDLAKLRLEAEGRHGSTQVRYFAVLRGLFRLAIRRRWVVGLADPTAAVDWPKETTVPRRVPTALEVRRLVNAAEPVIRPLVLVAMLTGLRISSILRLTAEDARIRPGLLRVVQKGGRELWLPMTPVLAAVVRRAPFTWPDGRRVTRFPRKAWRRSLAAAGVAPFGFHQLRHLVGDWLTERQTHGRVVQAMLGHSSQRMTERYTRPRDPALRRAQVTMARLLGPVPPRVPPRQLTTRRG